MRRCHGLAMKRFVQVHGEKVSRFLRSTMEDAFYSKVWASVSGT